MRFVAALIFLLGGTAVPAFSASPKMRYLVVTSRQAQYELPEVGRPWAPGDHEAFRPPFGRVLRGFEKYTQGRYAGTWDVLVDNGQGMGTGGYLSEKDVSVFVTQEEAEAFALKLDQESAHLEPVLADIGGETRLSHVHRAQTAPSAGSGASGAEANHTAPKAIPYNPTSSSAESTPKASQTGLPREKSAKKAKKKFLSIRSRMQAELGSSFLSKLTKSFEPSAADRRKFIAAAEKVLDPGERAMFGLIATAWAEERASFSNPACGALTSRSSPELIEKCREDSGGRANMLFTMKIIDNRAEPLLAHRQFTHRDYWHKGKLERVWGVITKDRAFSSWNAESRNAGNMMAVLMGRADHMDLSEHVSLERALRAYRDYSSGGATFQGFSNAGHYATLMINRQEVTDIRAVMKRRQAGLEDDRPIVSWSIERGMKRLGPGVHEVGVRVPGFSISVPPREGAHGPLKITHEEMGHGPDCPETVDKAKMESVRKRQGGW